MAGDLGFQFGGAGRPNSFETLSRVGEMLWKKRSISLGMLLVNKRVAVEDQQGNQQVKATNKTIKDKTNRALAIPRDKCRWASQVVGRLRVGANQTGKEGHQCKLRL